MPLLALPADMVSLAAVGLHDCPGAACWASHAAPLPLPSDQMGERPSSSPQELPSFEELMNPKAAGKGGPPALVGGARTSILAKTRKFVASADTQDQALALYVNSQVRLVPGTKRLTAYQPGHSITHP